MEGWRLGQMASQEGQRRGFLRGEERAVVTARPEDGHGPGGQGAGERPDVRVEGIAVGLTRSGPGGGAGRRRA